MTFMTLHSDKFSREAPARRVRDEIDPQENCVPKKKGQRKRWLSEGVRNCRFATRTEIELDAIAERWEQSFAATVRDLVEIGLAELKKRGDL